MTGGRRPTGSRRRPLQPLVLAVVSMTLGVVVPATSALAHAELLGATPGPGTTVAHAPLVVRLQFSEGINDALSTIQVWDGRGSRVDRGTTRVERGNGMLVFLHTHLKAGTYEVTWAAISADDGHATTGTYRFNVLHPGSVAREVGRQGNVWVSWMAVLARWIELTAEALWLALMVFSVFIVRRRKDAGDSEAGADLHASTRAFQAVPWTLLALLGASTVTLLAAAHTAIGSWSRDLSLPVLDGLVLHTAYGALWLVRQSLVVIALALWFAARWMAHRAPPVGAVGNATPWGSDIIADYSLALAGGYGLMLAASGHAAAVTVGGGGILGAPVLLDWVHVLASGVWVGGILVIVAVLAPCREPAEENTWFVDRLDRFSAPAYGSVACLAASGAFNADVHLAGWSQLWLTIYGHALLAKLSLIFVMVVVSGMTVRRVRPRLRSGLLRATGSVRLARDDQLLMRYLRLNAAFGVAVFLATAIMNLYPVSGASLLA